MRILNKISGMALASLVLSAGTLVSAPGKQAQAKSTEALPGFSAVVSNQIQSTLGLERLPSAMGMPLTAGIYVSMSPSRMTIFDSTAVLMKNGLLPDWSPDADCKSGCSRIFFTAFRQMWTELSEESSAMGIGLPSAILFGVDQSIPARTVLNAAYAAAESRVGPALPQLYFIVNGGQAGLRERPFYLLPPGGLQTRAGDRILGLRVSIEAGESYQVSAANPRFKRVVTAKSAQELKAVLADIHRTYPSKDAIVLDAGASASVADIMKVAVLAQKDFPKLVLTAGGKVMVGSPT